MARERARPDVIEKQKKFKDKQRFLNSKKLIFIDESGFRLGGTPRYGWAPRGIDAPGSHVQGHWKKMTMIGAISIKNFRGFMTIDAGTSLDVFTAFVEYQLVPNLEPGNIVIMDNLNVHKNPTVIKLIEDTGAIVLFTPPYSPEFNPIEKTWGKMKDGLRRMNTLTREAFDDALASVMDSISENDLRGWFEHAGYAIN